MPAGDAVYSSKETQTFAPQGPEVPVAKVHPELGKMHNFNSATPGHPKLTGEVLAGLGDLRVDACQIPRGAVPVAIAGSAASSAVPAPVEVVEPRKAEERVQISSERLAFLERIEAFMAEGSKVQELKRENETLLSIVSRLTAENTALKARK